MKTVRTFSWSLLTLFVSCGLLVRMPNYEVKDRYTQGDRVFASILTKGRLTEQQIQGIDDLMEEKSGKKLVSLDFFFYGQDTNTLSPWAIAKTDVDSGHLEITFTPIEILQKLKQPVGDQAKNW